MPTLPSSCPVVDVPAVHPSEAKEHFARLLALETDCWDVHASLDARPLPFVLLDVRSPELFRQGHIAGALNLPHRQISPRTVEELPAGKLLVVYCAGPHCNGADRAALKLAALGRPVKKMIGGVTGWRDEGFSLVQAP